MFLRETRPTLDSGSCFICEQAPETEYVDTLFNYEPTFFDPMAGRKFVCRYCIETMAKLIGFEDPVEYRSALDEAQIKIADYEDSFAELRKLVRKR